MKFALRSLLLLVLVMTAAPVVRAQREKLPEADLEFVEKNWPDARKTSTGIRYVIQQEGTGEPARPGDFVYVIYAARLLDGRGDRPVDRVFRELPGLLQPGDLLVFNDTRVLKARLHGEKATGGSVEALVERVLPTPPGVPGELLAHVRASKSRRSAVVM